MLVTSRSARMSSTWCQSSHSPARLCTWSVTARLAPAGSVRSTPGGKWATQFGNDYTTVPAWFRLQRVGKTFFAFQSSDGAAWFKIGQADTADADVPSATLEEPS